MSMMNEQADISGNSGPLKLLLHCAQSFNSDMKPPEKA